MNFSHTQTVIKYGTDLSKSCRVTYVYLDKSVPQTGQKSRSTQPDWLKTTEVARNGGMYLKKKLLLMFCVKCLSALILSLLLGDESVVKKYQSTHLTGTSPCSADKRKSVLWSIKRRKLCNFTFKPEKTLWHF